MALTEANNELVEAEATLHVEAPSLSTLAISLAYKI